MSSVPLRILHAASEALPLVKTGGLADVLGALPKTLVNQGLDARVVIPGYRTALAAAQQRNLRWLPGNLTIEAGGLEHHLGVGEVIIDGVRFYILACNELYDREGIYGPTAGSDYEDNPRRYAVFCKAVLALPGFLRWKPHIIHAHDWQTGLLPALLQRGYLGSLPATRTVFSIHNIAYQGAFWHWDMKLTGLDWSLFNPLHLEHFGRLNCLKAGIVFADRVTTVSQTYAQEIQSPEFGYGLDAVVCSHNYKLTGITNGIDADIWNPTTDPYLPAHFSSTDLTGKKSCKKSLQEELGLPVNPHVCLVGLISRLVHQKGIDLVLEAVDPYILANRMQLVVLGTGEFELEQRLRQLAQRHPTHVRFWHGYNEGLSHRIEAGADMFLMPSRFEPCGLNQMYSLRYGTLPLVRHTGGLADTVRDVASGDGGNGFSFGPMDLGHFSSALDRALGLFAHFPERWHEAQQAAMAADNSWEFAAQRYATFYQHMVYAE